MKEKRKQTKELREGEETHQKRTSIKVTRKRGIEREIRGQETLKTSEGKKRKAKENVYSCCC